MARPRHLIGSPCLKLLLSVIAMTFAPCGYATEAPKLVVAMGTSLTARGGWVTALAAELTRCVAAPVAVEPLAKSGASSDWGLTVVDAAVARAPDIVLVEFAANDAALNRFMSPSASAANLRRILARLTEGKPKPKVIVMAMNPVWGLRGLVRPLLSLYVNRSQRTAREGGAEFLDFRPSWNELSSDELHRAIPDGLHPAPEFAIDIMIPELTKRILGRPC